MRFLKEWGGWVSTVVTVVVASAIFISTQKDQAEDIQEMKQSLENIGKLMENQLVLNGRIIQYMEMDSR